jgi:hypothetical protein
MAHFDWEGLWNAQKPAAQPKRRYAGANVKFFSDFIEDREKTAQEGRPIFNEIPSISIRWPGMDETVRRVEPQDINEYPELWAAYKSGTEPITGGIPLSEWPLISASVVKELSYLGFRSVEQLAQASDEVKRKLGTAGRYVKMAKDWLDASNSTQFQVVKLQRALDEEKAARESLEEKLEILLQRLEANEGTDLRDVRKDSFSTLSEKLAEDTDEDIDVEPRRRGRPRKV